MIRLENIKKTLAGREILKGVNIHVRKGETMVILGASGSGKSVSLKHIMGLFDPDEGEVFIDNEPMSYVSKAQKTRLRSRMGVLFQSGALINWLTVYENLALPLREHRLASNAEIDRIVTEKLEWLGLWPARDLLPGDLSGGMKKRVGLGRALTTNPEILLYDEPTSGLDPVMSQVINELVVKMQRELKVTQVVISHDIKSAYFIADRIAFLYQGVVEFIGTPDEVRNTENQIVQQFTNGRTEGPMILDVGDPTTRKSRKNNNDTNG